jgi:hypothetical protein
MSLQEEILAKSAQIKTDSYPMSIGELVNLYREALQRPGVALAGGRWLPRSTWKRRSTFSAVVSGQHFSMALVRSYC